MELMDRMIDNLIASTDWVIAAQQSFKDMHVKGLTYINLLRTERLTVKLYMFDACELNTQGHLVYPHNHAYNFYHKTLIGSIDNIRFKPVGVKEGGSTSWQVWEYQSGLSRGITPRLRKVDLKVGLQMKLEQIVQGDSYYLDQTEIHTIRPTTSYSAAALMQFHDIHKPGVDGTTMFVPNDEMPNCAHNLYHKMSADECHEHVAKFVTLWTGEDP